MGEDVRRAAVRSHWRWSVQLLPTPTRTVTTFMLAVLWASPTIAGPADSGKTCSDKFVRASAENKKDNDALNQKIKKANNAVLAKEDPLKYCDWHKANVLPAMMKSIRRMEALVSDANCAKDAAAVSTYERLVANYKQDERGLSAVCLGLKDE